MVRQPNVSGFGFKNLQSSWRANTTGRGAKLARLCLSWLATALRSEGLPRRQPGRAGLGNIVELSTQLREGQITVYSIDPSAIGDIAAGLTEPPTNHLTPSSPKVYIGGASKPSDVRMEDLTLAVIADQSGGLVLNPGNDLLLSYKNALLMPGFTTRSHSIPPLATSLTNTTISQFGSQNPA